MDEILRLFPEHMKNKLVEEIGENWVRLQEIRFRLFRPLELIFDREVIWLETVRPDQKDGAYIVGRLSKFSLYQMEEELREGYITIEGGHRVGIAGKVNTVNGSVKALKHITFLNIRIAKEIKGVSVSLLPHMYEKGYLNTLFVGAPQSGKTTIIRDLTRLIATGWGNVAPKKVGVIDERSEIGASIKGVPQHDLGIRTDVMDACPKAEGMIMMIRSMSPEILIVDEIGSKKDVQALLEAINAGVTVICTIHGQSLNELKKRPSIQPLLDQHVFARIIILEKQIVPGQVKEIYNQFEEKLLRATEVLGK